MVLEFAIGARIDENMKKLIFIHNIPIWTGHQSPPTGLVVGNNVGEAVGQILPGSTVYLIR